MILCVKRAAGRVVTVVLLVLFGGANSLSAADLQPNLSTPTRAQLAE
jgi:hypothetical protein